MGGNGRKSDIFFERIDNLMNFSEFANLLYPHCGEGQLPAEFVKTLIDRIMAIPTSNKDINALSNDTYNPLASLEIDTLSRIYKGKYSISKRNATIIKGKIDKHQFATYINNKPLDVQLEIATSMQKHIPEFDCDDIGQSCAELFSKVLDDIFTSGTSSSKSFVKTSTNNKSIHEVPATQVYYNHLDGKIHIGNESISMPKEVSPPDNIAEEEDVYINQLFAAYCDAEDRKLITKDDITTLPKKYQRNFQEQRKNFYNAKHICHSVKEIFVDGSKQFDILKNDIYDYISETYEDDYDHGYARLISVLKKVVDSNSTSLLSSMHNIISPKAKKGICHMLVNDAKLSWVIDED